jgi:DNA repair exonuclease SbcCD ATPase subunit
LTTIRNSVTTLQKIQPPDSSKKKTGLEEKIKLLEQQIAKLKDDLDGITPFDDMATDNEQQIVVANGNFMDKNNSLSEMKGLVEYYAFWTIAFGDAGIRKYVIDEIIPALNDNVNYWLNFLIDNKLEIKFDNELNETISKFPEAKNLSYHILSNGQRRRINLALSQSFAHVMSLNTGRYPSLVFLDEVTTNIDPVGVEGIYNMICELAKDKQVIVTTHDHDLLELLNGCHELKLKMQNGASNLV